MYHIYVRGKCKYYCLTETQFNIIWNHLQHLTWVTDLDLEDLDYEELDESEDVFVRSLYSRPVLTSGAI